jgi:hypothetical protein
LAFIKEQDRVLHGAEHTYTLMDEQILEQIQELTSHIDPLEWPSCYKLNDDLVLTSRDTGRIWVPPNEQLRQEILASHHDGKIVGHLGTVGTLELVGRKY